MNVVSLRPEPQIEPLAFTIGARVDLRVGALAAGVVRPRGSVEEAFCFTGLARLLRAARMTWLERGASAPLALALPSRFQAELDSDLLSAAAQEAGCTRRSLAFEVCERVLAQTGPALAEELRARGWSVTLRGDPTCPFPLDSHARSVFSEIVLDAPDAPDPFLACDEADRSALGQRVLAAKEAAMIVTAEGVRNAKQAKVLAIAGFDRGGGLFAEAALR
jgi:hypothetical protein